MTPLDIRYLIATATAVTNKIYACRDEAGQLRYWIGTKERRLREITAAEASAIQDKNKTVPVTVPTTTTTTTTTTSSGSSCEVDYTATMLITAFSAVISTGLIADSTVTAHRNRVIGIAKAVVNIGFIGQAVSCGEVINPLWGWTIGDKIFLNGTTLSTTAPTTGWSQMLGTAVASDTIEVNLQPTILL